MKKWKWWGSLPQSCERSERAFWWPVFSEEYYNEEEGFRLRKKSEGVIFFQKTHFLARPDTVVYRMVVAVTKKRLFLGGTTRSETTIQIKRAYLPKVKNNRNFFVCASRRYNKQKAHAVCQTFSVDPLREPEI